MSTLADSPRQHLQTLRGNTCRLPGTARADSRGVHSPKINDPAYCPENIKQEVMNYITTYIYQRFCSFKMNEKKLMDDFTHPSIYDNAHA